MKHWPFIILCFLLVIYLGHQSFQEEKWNGWAFGSAQTLLTVKNWTDGGAFYNKFVFIPKAPSKIISYFNDTENRLIDNVKSGRPIYHYPTGYIIPYFLLAKIGITERYWFSLLAVFFSLSALILLYCFFYLISKNITVSFFAILYYAISAQFLVFADSLANQPIDELLRNAILVFSLLAIRFNKSEIRNSKFETNSNDKNTNDQNLLRKFRHLNFGIVSDFARLAARQALRASNFLIWILYFILCLSSYDSTFFVFIWLIGLEIITEWSRVKNEAESRIKKFVRIFLVRGKKILFFASAPVLAFILQLLQNYWYLGLSDTLWDIKNILFQRTTVGPGNWFLEQHIRSMLSPLAYMTALQVKFGFFIIIVLLGILLYLNKKNNYNFNGFIFAVLALSGLIAPFIFLTMAYFDYSGRQLAPALGLLLGYGTVAMFQARKWHIISLLLFLLSILWSFQIYRTVIYIFDLPSNYPYRHAIHKISPAITNFYKKIDNLTASESLIFYLDNLGITKAIFGDDYFVESYYANRMIIIHKNLNDFIAHYSKIKNAVQTPFDAIIVSPQKELIDSAAALLSLSESATFIEGRYVLVIPYEVFYYR